MNWFLYRLLAPRPDFATTMSEEEMAAMGAHAEYWRGYLDGGRVLVFSPVADPAGSWGMAVVNGETAEEVAALGARDPVVVRGICTYDVLALPFPVVAEIASPADR